MATEWPAKDPEEVLDFGLNFDALLEAGEVIASGPDWTIPAPLVGTLPGLADAAAVVRLAGGVDGADYRLAAKVTTDLGRTFKRSRVLAVRTR